MDEDQFNSSDQDDLRETLERGREALAQWRLDLPLLPVSRQIPLRDAILRAEAALDPASGVIEGSELAAALGAVAHIITELKRDLAEVIARPSEFETDAPEPEALTPEQEATLDSSLSAFAAAEGIADLDATSLVGMKKFLGVLFKTGAIIKQLRATLVNARPEGAVLLEAAIVAVEEAMKPGDDRGIDPRARFRSAFENLMFLISDLQTNAHTRILGHTARVAEYWSRMPQEKWDSLSAESREDLSRLVADWKTRYREEYLGQLPIEERRRIEAEAKAGE